MQAEGGQAGLAQATEISISYRIKRFTEQGPDIGNLHPGRRASPQHPDPTIPVILLGKSYRC